VVQVPIMTIPSRYRWFVSGTPFPSHDVAMGILEFLISKKKIIRSIIGGQGFYII